MAKKEASSEMTPDELRKLSPEERIRYLKDLEARRRKTLEEERRKAEDEIKAAKELIRETEEELDEDIELDREKEREEVRRQREEGLDEIVRAEKIATEAQQELFPEYKIGSQYKSQAHEYRPGAAQGIDARIGEERMRMAGDRERQETLYTQTTKEGSDESLLYAMKERDTARDTSEYSGGVRAGTSLEITANMYKR
jgi:superfamily II DNA/RNA helicase